MVVNIVKNDRYDYVQLMHAIHEYLKANQQCTKEQIVALRNSFFDGEIGLDDLANGTASLPEVGGVQDIPRHIKPPAWLF
eukprot:2250407-Alexandrium_andersonii.AAC.1